MAGPTLAVGETSHSTASFSSQVDARNVEGNLVPAYPELANVLSSVLNSSPSAARASRASRRASASHLPLQGATTLNDLVLKGRKGRRCVSNQYATSGRHSKENDSMADKEDGDERPTARALWPSSTTNAGSFDNPIILDDTSPDASPDLSSGDESDCESMANSDIRDDTTPDTSPDISPATTPNAEIPKSLSIQKPTLEELHIPGALLDTPMVQRPVSEEETAINMPPIETPHDDWDSSIEASPGLGSARDASPDSDSDNVSSATPYAEPKAIGRFRASAVTDGCIADEIRDSLPANQLKENPTKAKNYVFPVKGHEGVFKLGQSKDPKSRMKEIEGKCGVRFGDTLTPDQPPIKLYAKVEKLVHAQFKTHRFELVCSTRCKVAEHREYFEVSADIALAATHRWTAFCEQEPWDPSGKLNPFWEERLEIFQRMGDKVNWDEFVNATSWDRTMFDSRQFFKRIWEQLWPIVCILQAVFTLCVNYQSKWTVGLSVIIILAAVGQILFDKLKLNRGCSRPFFQWWQKRHAKIEKRWSLI